MLLKVGVMVNGRDVRIVRKYSDIVQVTFVEGRGELTIRFNDDQVVTVAKSTMQDFDEICAHWNRVIDWEWLSSD